MRRLEVNDYTCGVLRSEDIGTDIPFTEQFAKADTIQRANAVIAAYTNANYEELQNYNEDVEEIREEVEGFSETKQDILTAGDNITITEENVISATDTTYTAGTGIEITEENVINNTQSGAIWGSITGTLSNQTDLDNALSDKQDTLTAGSNIQISEENVISATNTTYSAGSGISISGNNEISLNATIPSALTTHSNTNNDTYACNYINEISDYSTTEKIVGKWVNGENLYRKVIIITSGWSTGENTMTIPDITTGLSEIVNISGALKLQQSDYSIAWLPIVRDHPSDSNWKLFIMNLTNNSLTYYLGSKYNEAVQKLLAIRLIVLYTKS